MTDSQATDPRPRHGRLARCMPALLVAIALASGVPVRARQDASPATQPRATDELGLLGFRANQAFNSGSYAEALDLYKRLAVRLKDDPARVSPVLERVRACERELARNGVEAPQAAAIGADRKPHPAPVEGQVYGTTLQELGNFTYDAEKGGDIPEDVRRLHQTQVKVRGYMIPLEQTNKITRFALVPDLFACCFGQPPQIQHTMVVDCPPGRAVAYYPDEIDVTGTLTVQEKREDGFVVSVFELTASSIRPSPK